MSGIRALSKYWLYTEDFAQDPYPYWEKVRTEEPVREVKAPDGTRSWVVSRYPDVRPLLADQRLSRDINRLYAVMSRQLGREYKPDPELSNHLVDVDPPRHTRLRKQLTGTFTKRRTELMRPAIEEIADGLLDRLAESDQPDLVTGLASPLPIMAVAELLGVPKTDWADFDRWSATLLRTDASDESGILDETVGEVSAYMRSLIRRKRADPQDDLMSALIHAEDEERLDDGEVLSTCIALMTGGNQTTVGLLGGGALALLQHPEQAAQLRADPSLWPTAVEELIRYVTPVNCALKRVTKEPITVGDVTIPADEVVILSITSANRDEQHFVDDPSRFDITRKRITHVSFGHGIHFCSGAHLARLEIEAAFSRMLTRFPKIRLDIDESDIRYHRDIFVRAVVSLPVTL
ncbi:cytochrome P450 family protein [Micromonospora sp. DT201]|uniref:cytochrome P450 family protein n=1 Tax=Micromonospora sp. DT201 TaxID=3393442 RepID=UPI003CFA43BC